MIIFIQPWVFAAYTLGVLLIGVIAGLWCGWKGKKELTKQLDYDINNIYNDCCDELDSLPENKKQGLDIDALKTDEEYISLIASGLSAEDAVDILKQSEAIHPSEYLTNDELKEIVKRVSKGEKIKF